MAKFNEILSGRYNRILQKLFGMKGGPPAAQLAGEIQPSLQFFRGQEERYLEGWTLVSGFGTTVATAGSTGKFRIRNPTNSGVILVITKLAIADRQATNTFTIGWGPANNADFGNQTNPTVIDARLRQPGVGASGPVVGRFTFAQDATGATGTGVGIFAVDAANKFYDMILTHDQEMVMLPGDGLGIFAQNVNQSEELWVMWRERAMEESELS